MKKNLLLLSMLLCAALGYTQELNFKEYSYTEFFQLIEEEQDTVFELKDAIIRFNKETDSIYAGTFNLFTLEISPFRKEQLIIEKELNLNNIQFIPYDATKIEENSIPKPLAVGFINITFSKSVKLNNTISLFIYNSTFNQSFLLSSLDEELLHAHSFLENHINENGYSYQDITLQQNTFLGNFRLDISNYLNDDLTKIIVDVIDNEFNGNYTYGRGKQIGSFNFEKNNYKSITRPRLVSENNRTTTIENNYFNKWLDLFIGTDFHSERLTIVKNIFEKKILLSEFVFPRETNIDWNQWKDNLVLRSQIFQFDVLTTSKMDSVIKQGFDAHQEWIKSSERIENYINNGQSKIKECYLAEIKFRFNFYNHYKNNYDLENANSVYADIKDLETKWFEHLYETNPTFKTFFKWRINQFLKVFSGYGKEPERAIIFSMYVILIFAFIYLLFPNSWDSLGKKRLMHRFEFFQKYLRRNDGMHTIYLEGQQQEISSYQDFKMNLESSKTELPSFFIRWSKPLYNASMFSSRLMARFLKSTDILKGKWQDLTPKQKRWKNIQIGFLLTIGLFYDLCIKMLNALMLSINTFTTLGFGEIPIKGLPRYLAIIQGFIGWFMLTIFSVSLISQLLN